MASAVAPKTRQASRVRSSPVTTRNGSTALKDLQRIPGVGPSLAQDLVDLGIQSVAGLRGRDPQELYDRLCRITGAHQDRCVLYVFRCAVYFASEEKPEPELLKWWNWKDTKLKAAA